MLLGPSDSHIAIIENHDESYHIWKAADLKDAAVVHIDAHHDLFDVKDSRVPCIADYLRWAVKERIASEVIWVAPSPAWGTDGGRDALVFHLKALAEGRRCSFDGDRQLGQTTVSGRKVVVCSLKSLPEVRDPLLLDIDVDYMLIDVPPFSEWHQVPEKPWIWPDELGPEIRGLAQRAQKVTVCYSAAGGFTPVMWKHLGNDLAAILAAEDPAEAIEYANLKRRAIDAFIAGDAVRFAELSALVDEIDPRDPSMSIWRSLACLKEGSDSAAGDEFRRAVELDASYTRTFSFGAPIFESHGDTERAREAYRMAVRLNERDALGWYGLGRAAVRKGELPYAWECLETAASLPDAPAEVHRELGALAEVQGRRAEAIGHCIRYLRLSFAGRSLDQPLSSVPAPEYRSPFWSEGYTTLSRLYAAEGRSRAAANCQAQALRLMNPKLYTAARPILRKMAGGSNVSFPQTAAAVAKVSALGAGLALRHLGGIVRRQVLRITGRGLPSGRRQVGRLFPPVSPRPTVKGANDA